jgi:hypothetical protein
MTILSANYMKIFGFSTHYRAKNVPPGGFFRDFNKIFKKIQNSTVYILNKP